MENKEYKQILEKYRRLWRLINDEYLTKGYKSNVFGQGKMLNILSDNKGVVSQKELVVKMNITAPSLSELLDKCEKNNYIERFKSESDKRCTYVKITKKGIALLEENKEVRQDTSSKIFSLLDIEEKEVFEKILDKLIIKITKEKGGEE